jgi:hypothetical protein
MAATSCSVALIGHHAGEGLGQAAGKLTPDHRGFLSGLTLVRGFADADNRRQPGRGRRLHLGMHQRIGLAVVLPPLGMAQDHPGGAGIAQHRRRDIAGMRTLRRGVAVLSADGDGRAQQHMRHTEDLGERRADQQVAAEARRGIAEGTGDRARLRRQPVHLPVSGNQLAHGVPRQYRLLSPIANGAWGKQVRDPARRSGLAYCRKLTSIQGLFA